MKFPKDLAWKATGRTLGSGAQGDVQVVVRRDGDDDDFYVLKALKHTESRQAYERFAKEIEALKHIAHDGVLDVVDHSKVGDAFHYYVTEHCEGAKSLRQLMDNHKNPYHGNALAALKFFEQLCDVLSACHAADPPVIHRDLKPGNVLVLPDGTIRLIDFGLCQIDGASTVTLIDEGVGTQNYMAPECEAGAGGVPSPASDLYSAGKILWAAITNHRAFAREAPAFTTMTMHELFPDMPETWHLHHIFAGTIRHEPRDRLRDGPAAVQEARRVRHLIVAGFPPLELLETTCGVCGVGELKDFTSSHTVFGNPNPGGIRARKCDYCGRCSALDLDLLRNNLKGRGKLL